MEERTITYDFTNKTELLNKLQSYADTPDSDNIHFKELIKDKLLHCPELLYAIHNTDLEDQLFDKRGNLLTDGEWSLYFGDNSNIRPRVFIPQTQDSANCYVCYKTGFDELMKYSSIEKEEQITFIVLVHGEDITDELTGIPRHDLIAAILTSEFNYSNTFGKQCVLVSDQEGYTDNNYVTRTLVFQLQTPNGIVQTQNGKTGYINRSRIRK